MALESNEHELEANGVTVHILHYRLPKTVQTLFVSVNVCSV